jgi:predicted metal-dependent hydrolase
MKALTFVVDYVVIHDLAHLFERNHTMRFWKVIAVQTPCYELAKKWLGENGNLLEEDR